MTIFYSPSSLLQLLAKFSSKPSLSQLFNSSFRLKQVAHSTNFIATLLSLPFYSSSTPTPPGSLPAAPLRHAQLNRFHTSQQKNTKTRPNAQSSDTA